MKAASFHGEREKEKKTAQLCFVVAGKGLLLTQTPRQFSACVLKLACSSDRGSDVSRLLNATLTPPHNRLTSLITRYISGVKLSFTTGHTGK